MNKSRPFLLLGILAIIMGFSDDTMNFISSEAKLAIGVISLSYGIFLFFKEKKHKK
nr:hypothetical protein [uncultured Psychroserpens sp.]